VILPIHHFSGRVGMNFDYTDQLVKATESLIYSSAKVDVAERVVYYVELSGVLHQDDFTLAEVWNYTLGFQVQGEMAMSPTSDLLIVADARGVITGLQVAEISGTFAPSDMPSDMPSMAPSAPSAPVVPDAPVDTPTAPIASPVSSPTVAPVASPTDMPVESPVAPSAAFGRSSIAVAALAAVVSACLML
jgi:hypothetical protein